MPLFTQLFRFGIIGTLAALVHMLIVIMIVENINLQPLLANVIAFATAFTVSYFGHNYWTFNHQQRNNQQTVYKFFMVALASFLLNESLFFIFLNIFQLYYPLALFIVLLIVPPLTFIFSKFWAFKV